MKTRSRGLLLAILFLIPLLIRITYLIETKPHVIFYKGGAEASFFEEWASIRKGLGWIDISPPFREPLYPYLIGLIKIVSTSQNGIRIVQMLLASIVSVLIFLIGERLYGKTQGIIASICFALYPLSIFSSGAVNEGMLATFLLILSFYLLLRRNSPIYAFYSGIMLGLGFLSRFAIGIALFAWIVHLSAQGRSIARKTVLPLIIGSLIPIAVYQIFLLRSSDHCLFPTRSGWQAFLGAQGNTIPGDFLPAKIKMEGRDVTVNVASDLLRGQADARRMAKIESGIDLRESKINLHWIKRATESPKKNSLPAYFRRLGFLFGPYAPPSEFDSRFVGDYARILKIGIWLVPLIIPFGLMGVALNRNRQFVGLLAFIAIYGLVNPVLIVTDIDKLPLAAMVMVPAGAFCLAFYALFSKGLTTRGIYLAAITIALAIALGLFGSKLDKANQLVLLGNVYRDAFIAHEAKTSYEEALSENPMCIEAYIGISRSYTSLQNSSDALEVLNQAIKNGVDDPRLLIEKASLLLALGQKEEAIDLALPLAESHPLLPRLNELLGAMLFEQGETQTGIEYLEKEIQYGIPSPMTYGILGRAYLQTGDYQRAAENLEKAIGVRMPGTPMTSLIMMLADAYTGLGYHLKACNLLYQVAKNDVANIPLGLKFASCLYNAGRYKDALMELKHLRQFQPSNTDILLKMGETYVRLDSLDQAHIVWQEVLKIDPGNSIAKEKLKESGK